METEAIYKDAVDEYSLIQGYIDFASNFLDNTLPRMGLGTVDNELRFTLLPKIVCLCAGSYQDNLPTVDIPISKEVIEFISNNSFDPAVWRSLNPKHSSIQLFASKLGDISFKRSNICLVIRRSAEPQNIPHKMYLTSFTNPVLYENYQQRLLDARHNRILNVLYSSMQEIVTENYITDYDLQSLKSRRDIKELFRYHSLDSVSDLADLLRENSRNAGLNQCLINVYKLNHLINMKFPAAKTQLIMSTDNLKYFIDSDHHFALLVNAYNKWYIASPSHMLNPIDLKFPEDPNTGEIINRLEYIWTGDSEEEVMAKYMAVEGGSWRYF
ncbi:hypothetical protein KC669_01835 [Candidatus Dojkabacteria bacterium]|uniref:Uncharacterized protein n=1 Tax=Candidatus Dojkabacteria bacterium TaxID=2099670 RepID=A0A955LAM5_9BACT|nr:hypothetical protein [Candidatus Dojkabacteria bacterium]